MSVVCGKENKPCDYRLTDANQILSDFLGTEVSQYVGKMASTIYSDVTSKLQLLIEILESGMHKELDLCFERTGRLCHVVLYSPEKNEVVALFLDTTETIQAHQALDRSEKLFRNTSPTYLPEWRYMIRMGIWWISTTRIWRYSAFGINRM
jgi:hypothetical protein